MLELDLNVVHSQLDYRLSIKLDFNKLRFKHRQQKLEVRFNNPFDFLYSVGLLEQYIKMLDGSTYSKEILITYYIHFVSIYR